MLLTQLFSLPISTITGLFMTAVCGEVKVGHLKLQVEDPPIERFVVKIILGHQLVNPPPIKQDRRLLHNLKRQFLIVAESLLGFLNFTQPRKFVAPIEGRPQVRILITLYRAMASFFTGFTAHRAVLIILLIVVVVIHFVVLLLVLLELAAWGVELCLAAAPPHGAAPL